MPAASSSALTGKTMYHYVAYDIAFWPKNMAVTAANYPKIRLDSLSKLNVDTIVFAPALGFGSMAANLRNSAPIVHQPAADSVWMRSYKNGMPEMLKSDWDPIGETVKWCRAKKKEAVVALPVNLQIHGGSERGTRVGSGAFAVVVDIAEHQGVCAYGKQQHAAERDDDTDQVFFHKNAPFRFDSFMGILHNFIIIYPKKMSTRKFLRKSRLPAAFTYAILMKKAMKRVR